MPTTNLQQSPYLREQRQFPNENLKDLANQSDHAYIDIASKVNLRTIGIYATNFPVITGDSWYLKGQPQKQQSLRQVYTFTTIPVDIPHGINFDSVSDFSKIYGTFNTSSNNNFFPLPWVDISSVTNQISMFVTPTVISIRGGGGPNQPIPTSGIVVIEWISNL